MHYGLDAQGRPISHIRTMAMHTQNLRADARYDGRVQAQQGGLIYDDGLRLRPDPRQLHFGFPSVSMALRYHHSNHDQACRNSPTLRLDSDDTGCCFTTNPCAAFRT
jgi:hypothetical protein